MHLEIDTNHPFADRHMKFEVEITSVEEEERNNMSGVSVQVLKPGWF